MSISKYKIKKWIKMIKGDSILHVTQGIGTVYSKKEIKGYYNDLTEKITRDTKTLNGELPKYPGEDGVSKIFPIGIFQYGLGAYDLYLKTEDIQYLDKFLLCVEWTVINQDKNGGWKTFEHETPNTPYSAMAQGEAISLLARAYAHNKDKKYLDMIKKGMAFLTKPIEDGGVAVIGNNFVYLKEFVDRPVVLNGWIFALFGIYDYLLLFPNDIKIKQFYDKTIFTLIKELPNYDLGYWSKYDLEKKIASPFYHKLHIAQLNVLFDLTQDEIFKRYESLFKKYNKNLFYKTISFIYKGIQKIME